MRVTFLMNGKKANVAPVQKKKKRKQRESEKL